MPSYRELWRVDDGGRALAGGVRHLGQGHPAEPEGRRELLVLRDDGRDTTVFAVSEPLTLAEAPDASDVAGGSRRRRRRRRRRCGPAAGCSYAASTAAGEEQAESAVLADGAGRSPAAGGSCSRTTSRPRIERETVVVHGNVAAGHARRDGPGAARLGPRRAAVPALLALPRAAHLPAVDRSLRRRLDARGAGQRRALGRGCRRSTAAGRATASTPSRSDEQGRTYVQFGDGERGARLPSGLATTSERATARASAPPATSARARSRSCSTGRSGSRE